jgi:hypothetical protein
LGKRDRELVSEAVRTEAVKRGILDEDLVSLFDMTKVEVENGRVKRASVTELLDSMVESKPVLFKKVETEEEKAERERAATRDAGTGRFTRPNPQEKVKPRDWSKASDKELEEFDELVRTGRV